ncbi:MAG TPA: hypothetical protein VFU31_12325, partial [Candidatus Binatia bacterium]|nr:hypothetical protein [Candidatus Binatia bacterium]
LKSMAEANIVTEAVSEAKPVIPQAPFQEIDRLGADALLEDLRKVNESMPDRKLPVPHLLRAMADERQTFYKDGEVNPWLISFQESHAGH